MTLLIFDVMDVMLRLRMDDFKPVNLSMTLWAFARFGIPCFFFGWNEHCETWSISNSHVVQHDEIQHESFQKIWIQNLQLTCWNMNQKKIWFHIHGCFFCCVVFPPKKVNHLFGKPCHFFFPSCGVLPRVPPRGKKPQVVTGLRNSTSPELKYAGRMVYIILFLLQKMWFLKNLCLAFRSWHLTHVTLSEWHPESTNSFVRTFTS